MGNFICIRGSHSNPILRDVEPMSREDSEVFQVLKAELAGLKPRSVCSQCPALSFTSSSLGGVGGWGQDGPGEGLWGVSQSSPISLPLLPQWQWSRVAVKSVDSEANPGSATC